MASERKSAITSELVSLLTHVEALSLVAMKNTLVPLLMKKVLYTS